MSQRIKEGDKLPFFRYDTPYTTQERSRDLLAAHPPLVLVFMNNFGHPITRTFAERYAQTYPALTSGSLAMVVRSQPEKLAVSLRPGSLPFPLLCDPEGVLFDLFEIPRRNTLTSCSLEGWRILRQARHKGYRPVQGAQQQLPLTLIVDGDGTVLFVRYGTSVTDVPTDCEAMEQLLAALDLVEPDPLEEVDYLADGSASAQEADLPGDLFPEEMDLAKSLMQDPEDTLTQGLPLEDLAPELPGYISDSGQFVLPPETFDPAHYKPRAPLAPLGESAPPRRRAASQTALHTGEMDISNLYHKA